MVKKKGLTNQTFLFKFKWTYILLRPHCIDCLTVSDKVFIKQHVKVLLYTDIKK